MENDYNNPFVGWLISNTGQIKKAGMDKEAKEIGRINCHGTWKVDLRFDEGGHCITHVHICRPNPRGSGEECYRYDPINDMYIGKAPDSSMKKAVKQFFLEGNHLQVVKDNYTYKKRN